jgi:hypothetical protein
VVSLQCMATRAHPFARPTARFFTPRARTCRSCLLRDGSYRIRADEKFWGPQRWSVPGSLYLHSFGQDTHTVCTYFSAIKIFKLASSFRCGEWDYKKMLYKRLRRRAPRL